MSQLITNGLLEALKELLHLVYSMGAYIDSDVEYYADPLYMKATDMAETAISKAEKENDALDI